MKIQKLREQKSINYSKFSIEEVEGGLSKLFGAILMKAQPKLVIPTLAICYLANKTGVIASEQPLVVSLIIICITLISIHERNPNASASINNEQEH